MEYYWGIFSLCLWISCASSDLIPPCGMKVSVNISDGKVNVDGSILADGILYSPEHVFNYTDDDGIENTMGCICHYKNCISKCCPKGKILYSNETEYSCIDNEGNSSILFDMIKTDVILQDDGKSSNYEFLQSMLCDGFIYAETKDENPIYLFKNGSLNLNQFLYPLSDYCIGSINSENASVTFYLCYLEEDETQSDDFLIIYAGGMMISIPFMVATIIIYGMVPDLRNIHGKSIMAYTSVLLIGFIITIANNLRFINLSSQSCQTSAFIMYFSFLSSFYWLNIMSFDLWWSFQKMNVRRNRRYPQHLRFFFYGLYAWGCPLIMTGVAAIMQYHPSIPNTYIKPGFGEISCWFHEKNATFVYFYLNILILMIFNVIWFLMTTYKILTVTKETKAARKEGDLNKKKSRYERSKEQFVLYAKLFLVMGINWVAECISFIYQSKNNSFIWVIMDIYNSLQGVIIFIVFVCSRKTKNLILRRYQFIRHGSTFVNSRYFSRSQSSSSASSGSETNFESPKVSMNPGSIISNQK